ncbi:MAG: hypothetical protein HYZ17_16405 [Betaproteobacteria bacterium]|nr:hypothetical protein [Betaproteobacteria bacterium]
MANTLGSLVVRLGLDAAEFTSGLTKSEYEAKKLAASINKKIATAANVATIAITAMGAAALTAIYAVDKLVKQAGDFQDLAEKTGASAQALASLAVAAKVGGTDMTAIAEASIKLQKNLSKVNDESKGAGAALKAIGIPLKEFKQLDPAAQMDRLAKALAGFDDQGKTAVMEALVRGGAQLLPFLKELGEGIGRVNILTDQQIKLADAYADNQARARAELNLYAQALAVEAVPALTAVTDAAKDLIKEFLNLEGSTTHLKASSDILDWAETAALAIATVVEAAIGAMKTIRALGGSFESVWADIKLGAQAAMLANPANGGGLLSGKNRGAFNAALDERNKVVAEANQRYVDLWNYDGTRITKTIRKTFAEQRELLSRAPTSGDFSRQDRAAKKPKINTAGLAEGAAGSAGAMLRKELDGQLKAIREFAQQQRDGYEFANQYLRGVYDDGLTSLADFFDKQRALREAGLQSQLDAVDREVAALEAVRSNPALKPEQRVDAENKIAEAIQKRASIQQRASQSNILSVQDEARAFKQLAYSYYDFLASVKGLQGDVAGASALRIAKQTQEAQELLTKVGFDPAQAKAQAEAYGQLLAQTEALTRVQTDYSRLVEAAGLREQAASLDAQAAGASEIDTLRRIGSIRQDALGAMGEMVVKARELAEALGTPEARLFAEKLALQLRQAASEAEPLLQKARDLGRELGEGIGGNIEDALLARGKTMRERFLGLLEGIAADTTRILTRNLITRPLTDYLTNLIGGNGQSSGGGGLLGSLFGGSKEVVNTPQQAFRMTEIAAQNAATTALTASITAQNVAYTTGTTALAALTAAANSAAAALSAISMPGGSSGGLWGLFGGGSAFSPGSAASAGFGTGAAFGNLDIGGFLATGGPALPNTNYRVNERGPELLDVRGKQFLMMGNERGKVTPLAGRASGGDIFNISVPMPQGGSRQTAMQFGADVGRSIDKSRRNR